MCLSYLKTQQKCCVREETKAFLTDSSEYNTLVDLVLVT